MFWIFVKKNLTSDTAKMVWKALLVVPASQINMTFSAFSCCSVKCLELHFHISHPLLFYRFLYSKNFFYKQPQADFFVIGTLQSET